MVGQPGRAGLPSGVIVAFSVSPSGGPLPGGPQPGGTDEAPDSVSAAVAAAVAVVRASGLPNRTDSMFTTLEGEWDEVMGVVRDACQAVAAFGPRVSLVLKADIRPGYTGQLAGKVERVEAALAGNQVPPAGVEPALDRV